MRSSMEDYRTGRQPELGVERSGICGSLLWCGEYLEQLFWIRIYGFFLERLDQDCWALLIRYPKSLNGLRRHRCSDVEFVDVSKDTTPPKVHDTPTHLGRNDFGKRSCIATAGLSECKQRRLMESSWWKTFFSVDSSILLLGSCVGAFGSWKVTVDHS